MRTTAYSDDLRWRMVWQRKVQGLTLNRVAANLSVDTSTVHRINKQFDASGTVSKKQYSSPNTPVKLSEPVKLTVLHLVLNKPGIYLWEIQREISVIFHLEISPSALCQFLKKSNFCRKKMQLIALQRDQTLRGTYGLDVSLYPQRSLVFVDETGCDR